MIVVFREDRTIVFFNECAEAITAYTAADVLSRGHLDGIFPPNESQPGVCESLGPLFDGRETKIGGCEQLINCGDGSHRWVDWTAKLLSSYEGAPAAFLVAHDVTERRAAIAALRDQEARLRAVLDTAADGVVMIDDRGVIRSVNAAAEKIFRYSAAEMIGQNVSLLMPEPFSNEHNVYIQQYLETGRAKIIGIGREVEGRRKSGESFPCSVAVSEVKLSHGPLFTGIVRDITEQKRAEIRSLQAERLAAIGETVTGLAHESRNAFQRSQACLEMLTLELEDRPDELQLVERTQRALNHLHRLYEEVRDYAGQIKLDRQPCDISHVWRDAWSHLELKRRGTSIELRETISCDNLSCNVDWFAIGQVFRNILENAIDACSRDGVIELRCSDEGAAFRISLRDNGEGIEPGVREHVFDAFFTTRTKGTGLGMAIVKRILEAHGGSIEIGDVTTGAEFIVTLPRS
jgi:PAS domain S-box-containing protein